MDKKDVAVPLMDLTVWRGKKLLIIAQMIKSSLYKCVKGKITVLGSKYTYALHFSFPNYKMEKKILVSLSHNQLITYNTVRKTDEFTYTHMYACMHTSRKHIEIVKFRDMTIPVFSCLPENHLKMHHFLTAQKFPLSSLS